MKTLGYVNQFGRGIEMVQEELKTNKNGLAVFKFDDITTFKVTVMNADLEAVKMTENEAGTVQKNGTEKTNQNNNNIEEDTKNIANKEFVDDTEKIQKRYRKID
jgi:ATP-dependent DNA helicase RecG